MTILREVIENPSAYRFVPGKGYIRMGQPPIPESPMAAAADCEPPLVAVEGSAHMLQPPNEAEPMSMLWSLSTKTWMPYLGNGRRVAFTSAYLAAHGWSYIGPA